MKFQIFILKNHYDILYKTFMCAKRFRIWFDKVDRNIRVYDRSKYLTLFIPEIYDTIYDRTRYLISPKVVLDITLTIILLESELIKYNSLPI